MSRRGACRCSFACALLALAAILAAPAAAVSRRVEVRKVLDTAPLGDPFVFDVGPDGAVLVLTRDNIFDAGAEGPLFGEPLKDPAWLGFAGRNLQFLVDDVLYVVDGRVPRKLLDVPLKSRIFASDGERTFLAGISPDGKPLLFIFKESAGHKALLELDAPIDAMALARGELFFSVGPGIYTLREGGPARPFAFLPGISRIPSLAVDDARGLLYFSDGDDVYALRGNSFVVVRRGLGGMLRCRAGELFVLSWKERALFRMSGISEALLSDGTLTPWKDPCKDPVIGLYCRAERERAILKAALELSGSGGQASRAEDSGEMGAYAADREKELGGIETALAKEAASGAEGILWGGDAGPKAIGSNEPVATAKRGAAVALWDGSDLRIGPDSKAALGECRPSRTCRLSLETGLLYFESYRPHVEGIESRRPGGFEISAGALAVGFESARLAVFASGDTTGIVVLDGRVRAASRGGGGSVILAPGETLEARRGESLGTPKVADTDRINRWWEKIR